MGSWVWDHSGIKVGEQILGTDRVRELRGQSERRVWIKSEAAWVMDQV